MQFYVQLHLNVNGYQLILVYTYQQIAPCSVFSNIFHQIDVLQLLLHGITQNFRIRYLLYEKQRCNLCLHSSLGGTVVLFFLPFFVIVRSWLLHGNTQKILYKILIIRNSIYPVSVHVVRQGALLCCHFSLFLRNTHLSIYLIKLIKFNA